MGVYQHNNLNVHVSGDWKGQKNTNVKNKVGQGTQKQHGTQHSFSLNLTLVWADVLCREGLRLDVDATRLASISQVLGAHFFGTIALIEFVLKTWCQKLCILVCYAALPKLLPRLGPTVFQNNHIHGNCPKTPRHQLCIPTHTHAHRSFSPLISTFSLAPTPSAHVRASTLAPHPFPPCPLHPHRPHMSAHPRSLMPTGPSPHSFPPFPLHPHRPHTSAHSRSLMPTGPSANPFPAFSLHPYRPHASVQLSWDPALLAD